MKKLIIICLLLSVLIACKNEKNPIDKLKESIDKVKETKQDIYNIKEIVTGVEEVQKNITELSELTPVSNATFKSWMPEYLDGLKRVKYEIGKQMGFAKIGNIHIEFKDEDNKTKSLQLQIVDGAGSGASIVSMYNLMQNTDLDSEDQTGYERTQTFDGKKVKIKYSKPEYSNRSELKYLIQERLYVEATGTNMKPKEVWSYLKKLKIEKLIK